MKSLQNACVVIAACATLVNACNAAGRQIPAAFEPNRGQADSATQFLSSGPAYSFAISATGASLHLAGATPALVRWRVANADRSVHGIPEQPRSGVSNYLVGDDPRQWVTQVPRFGRVRFPRVYPGIDLTYDSGAPMEFNWELDPGADPRSILLSFGAESRLRIDLSGDLLVSSSGVTLRWVHPTAFQSVAGHRRLVGSHFELRGLREVGFAVNAYDGRLPLTIDPVLLFSSYFGGAGFEQGRGIALDREGNVYFCGATASANFPAVPLNDRGQGGTSAFVAKLSPTGELIFATTIGGGHDKASANGVALDSEGNIYLAGNTQSQSFPVVNPLQPHYGGNGDAFLLELKADGRHLVYSTFLGGRGLDFAHGVAVDSAGNAYVTGVTGSVDFPTSHAFQPGLRGKTNAFALKVAPHGSALVYSTLFGGSGYDLENGLSLSSGGDLIAFGDTASHDFPVRNAYQSRFSGLTDGWLAQFDAGGGLVFSTFIGAGGSTAVRGAQTDHAGNLVLTGNTDAADFPVRNAIQPRLRGGNDIWLAKLDATHDRLLFSTYIGGSGRDNPWGLALDPQDNIYVAGDTSSNDFPVVDALQTHNAGGSDAFFIKVDSDGTRLLDSTYLGGSGYDGASQVTVDASERAWIIGTTQSDDFPTVAALQPLYGGGGQGGEAGGGGDAFIAEIATVPLPQSRNGAQEAVPGFSALAIGAGSAPKSARPSMTHGIFSYGFALVWGGLILLAWIGWGAVIRRTLLRHAAPDWAVQAVYGVALSVVIGGLLNLFALISRKTILTAIVAGVVIALADFPLSRRRHSPVATSNTVGPVLNKPRWLTAAIVLVLCLATLQYAASAWVARTDRSQSAVGPIRFNPSDDLQAYFVYPLQMLDLGALPADPFGARRMETSLGGQSFLDTFALAALPIESLHLIDPGLAWLILLGLVWGACRTRNVAPECTWSLLILLLWVNPPVTNITSVLIGTALFLGLYRLIDCDEPGGPWPSRLLLAALLASALCSLKSSFIPAVAISLAVYFLFRSLQTKSLRPLVLGAPSVALCTIALTLPWMVAMHRSSGTYLFPVLGSGVHRTFHTLALRPWLQLVFAHLFDPPVLALLLLGAGFGFLHRPTARANAGLWALFAGAIGGLSAVAWANGNLLRDRYPFPFLLAAIFAFAIEAARHTTPRRIQLAAGAILVLFLGANWEASRIFYWDTFTGIHIALHQTRLVSDAAVDEYRTLQSAVPPAAPILTHLSDPYLLDFRRNTVYIADFAVSGPPPGLPPVRAAAPLERYLSSVSIRYVAYSYQGEAARRDVAVESPFHRVQLLSTYTFLDSLDRLAADSPPILDLAGNRVLSLDGVGGQRTTH